MICRGRGTDHFCHRENGRTGKASTHPTPVGPCSRVREKGWQAEGAGCAKAVAARSLTCRSRACESRRDQLASRSSGAAGRMLAIHGRTLPSFAPPPMPIPPEVLGEKVYHATSPPSRTSPAYRDDCDNRLHVEGSPASARVRRGLRAGDPDASVRPRSADPEATEHFLTGLVIGRRLLLSAIPRMIRRGRHVDVRWGSYAPAGPPRYGLASILMRHQYVM